MDTLQAQKLLIHWLYSAYYVDKRESLRAIVDSNVFTDNAYAQLWQNYDYVLKNGTRSRDLDWGLLSECSEEKLGFYPYQPEYVIEFLRQAKASKILTERVRDSLLKKGDKPTQELLEEIEGAIVESQQLMTTSEKTGIKEIMDEVLEERNSDNALGIATGIPSLDRATKRLREGHFWLIGGYTNTGKTGFMLQLVNSVCLQGKRALVISLEMTRRDLGDRLLTLNEYMGVEHSAALDRVAYYDLEITNEKFKLADIERYIKAQKPLHDVVFIDFVQNIITDDQSEYDRMTTVALALQRLAIEANICIVALSQVSNASAGGKTMQVMGFKGSGALASAATVGIELLRSFDTEQGNESVPITMAVRKNKFGPQFTSEYTFDRKSGFIRFNQFL